MDKKFHEVSLELVLLNSHNSSKETTINMGGRRDIYGTSNCLPCQNVQQTPCLAVNTNQTRIHLVSIGRDQTWERKGAKHIQVIGIKDEKQIMIVV